jgi:hypothetical protein
MSYEVSDRPPSLSDATRSRAPRWRSALCCRRFAVLLLQALACAGSQGSGVGSPASSEGGSAGLVRYRLPLRHNSVDAGQALRCYADCQSKQTPPEYLECLKACPGFETTPGSACEPNEVPPLAACFTARQLEPSSEPQPGSVVIGVLSGFTFVVGLASVCASSETQCSEEAPEAR